MQMQDRKTGKTPRFDASRSLISYVAELRDAQPDALAILTVGKTWTYSDLLTEAERVAHHLIELGTGPGDYVGVCATRSADALIAMLGALRAGAAYVPLDPSYASEVQLRQIIAQVPFRAVLYQNTQSDLVNDILPDDMVRVSIGAIPDHGATTGKSEWPVAVGEDPVCMVFTSGTTGKPKGVVLPNRGLASFGLDQTVIAVLAEDRVLHASSLACDGGLIEVWLAFLNGAALALVENARPALGDIAATMKRHAVTVTSQYVGMQNLLIDHYAEAFSDVRLTMAGGDVQSPDHIRRLKSACPDLRYVNIYGPSETTCISLVQQVENHHLTGAPVPIGEPMTHEWAFVVDEDLRLLPDGEWGQLAIGGYGVALGCYGMPDRTAKVFVEDPRPGQTGKVYLTGDLAMRRPDGVFEFGGRADRQVKLGGRRIELDGIEHVLRSCPGVLNAVVEVAEAPGGDRRIGAVVQPKGGLPEDEARFRQQLLQCAGRDLHREMLPKLLLLRRDIPVTTMGKPDRKACRSDLSEAMGEPLHSPQPASRGAVRETIAAIWQDMLACGPIGDDKTFFEAGGSSLGLIDAHARMQRELGLEFELTLLFEKPQFGALSAELASRAVDAAEPEGVTEQPAEHTVPDNAIAIIGLAARVPGAGNLDEFWQAVSEGRNLIHRFDPEELEDAVSPETHADPNYVPARSILDGVEEFDAKFFNILPSEAERMDPQARVFLELCVEALDDAGLDPARAGDATGVYAGSSISTYMINNVLGDRATSESFTSGFQIGNYATMTGNISDTLATRVAFKLNLKGPALTVHTACSTSLTAIAQAVTALRAGQCDVALAGGVSITFPQKRGYLTQEGGMSSPDGLCRPFDADAQGTVFGHGAGVLVLKPLARALADGDRVDAVIRGVGLNNDGSDKISFTAPSVAGQAEAIRAAHKDAGVAPDTVSYVECHGTATPLGDPIEVRALTQAFGAQGSCALGSVKGNIGHLDAGAGVVGVIKTVRMMREQVIPPVANFRAPNPRIDFSDGPFFVPDHCQPWVSNGPRRAGISGFGIGGTNAHVLLEEAPEVPQPAAGHGVQVLPLSAKSPEALTEMAGDLAEALPGLDLADVAFTLQEGRTRHPFRLAIAAETNFEAADRLRLLPAQKHAAGQDPEIAFMFPGQGGQYPGMGSGLYGADAHYTEWLDRGLACLPSPMVEELRPLLLQSDLPDTAEILKQTRLTQPALFLTQFACAQSWMARGICPDYLIGHSVGEFTAAALAKVMSFEDAMALVVLRGQLMQDMPAGCMLSVRTTIETLQPYLTGPVDLAARNAPKLQVVAGPEAAIDALADRLASDGISSRRLHTSHAFHSAMMTPAAEAFAETVASIDLSAPGIPVISTMTGSLQADLTDPEYWAQQMRSPVRFADALETLADRSPVLLEVGAGNTLGTFSAQTLPRAACSGVVQSLPDHTRAQPDATFMAQAFGQLWCAGVPVDWSLTGRGARKLRLPGTRFIRKRHWIDAPVPATTKQISEPNDNSTIRTETKMSEQPSRPNRRQRLISELTRLFADLSGEDLSTEDADTSFLELGFDSLFMGQAAQALLREYSVSLSFRALLSEYPSLDTLAQHLDDVLPAEAEPVETVMPVQEVAAAAPAQGPAVSTGDGNVAALLQAQLQTMQAVFSEQLRTVGGNPDVVPQAAEAVQPVRPAPALPAADPAEDQPKAFKVGRAPVVAQADLTPEQMRFVANLSQRYSAKFAGSKEHTQLHRAHHADPRSAAGFRPEWKELTFPIVAARSKGAFIEDVDGNRLIDLVNGFGQTAFGHAPEFVSDALRHQLELGYAIGPQADQAGPVAEKFARLTGHERVTFCNTGSEAVMAAMRVARTVTGRKTVVVFSNDYHGQFDEVLVKGKSRGEPGALPVAPGIPRDAVANMVVLGYGDASSLDWIRAHIADVAAVVVEPVQSRHPELRPADFVRELRNVTTEGAAALVMDEVVTGFRTHMRGMQGVWDIQPDMATYGKVVGGGMPIGVLAGNARFMDALDGGSWRYGDDSTPQTAPTFFAGTFVRHPLVVAAMDAVLDHLEQQGDRLWNTAADRAAGLARRMNAALRSRGLPDLVTHYSSWFVINVSQHDPRATLLHTLMRLDGVHTLDGFCGFLTTQHSEADCDRIAQAFETALDALQAVGILAANPDTARPVRIPAVATVPTGPVPLTESQREIWMTHQLGDLPAASFNESVSLRIDGPVDSSALSAALNKLVARHDALRLRFSRDGSEFEVMPPQPLELDQHDLTASPDPEAALTDLLRADARKPVDLTTGLPIRGMLAALSEETHVLVLTAHHIVCDGWSYNTLIEELGLICSGGAQDLPEAPSFAALAAQGAVSMSADTEKYWRDVYEDIPALPELPADRARGPAKSYAGATTVAEFDADLLKSVRKAGAKQGCTLFATLFAAVQITLGRLSGSGDVVLGVPTGGQSGLDAPETVGHLVNFLPIRAAFDPSEPAASHLKRVSDTVLRAFEHSDTTLGTLVRTLDIDRTLSRLPLTEVQFNLERLPDAVPLGAATMTVRANPKAAVNFDLFFNIVETGTGLRAEVDYNTHLFREETVQRWLRHLRSVLEAIASNATTEIRALPLLDPEEERQLATGHNPDPVEYPRQMLVQDLIKRHAEQSPDRIAVTDAVGTMTYGEIWDTSATLAAHLQTLAAPGARIGVAMPRNRSMLNALIAVLRAGMTYVPLDPSQPIARQRNVLQVAQAAAVIAPADAHEDLTAGLATLAVDPNASVDDASLNKVSTDPGTAAYVIFTSGSTGAPKGVAVPHRSVVNFLTSMAQRPGFTADDKILSVTTVSFDIAVLELFLPLSVGGQVEIASREQVLDGFELIQRLAEPDITVMQATPTLWGMLSEVGFAPRPGLRMLAGGEPLPADLAEKLSGAGELWNMYGPTETTIWSSVSRVEPSMPVTIGTPIANTELHVLDDQDRLCPPGVVGELNIGGEGLAIGYYERPDLTTAAFRTVRIAGEMRRLYRTGDLAIRQPDGTLTLLGRRDGQVKLRGYRIELGEIEARLRNAATVTQAAVALKKGVSGTDCLVAYIVPEDGGLVDEGHLSARLAAELPDYMVPSVWIPMTDLPQTANGKLDRKALPNPQDGAPVRLLRTVEPPVGDIETRIADIWQEALGLDEVSVTDTIFALGADSLTVFRIAARQIEAGLGLEAHHIFEHGTIRALAAQVQAGTVAAPARPSLKDFRRTSRTGT